MKINTQPIVSQQMLFRVPASRAFAAFVDSTIATKFWFSHADSSLVAGKSVTWEWRPYHHTVSVDVESIEPDKQIVVRWGDENKNSRIRWTFEPRGEDSTLVTVTNDDFTGFDDDELVSVAIDSMGGFSLVLANAKAYLEHGIELNLIFDKAPDAIKN